MREMIGRHAPAALLGPVFANECALIADDRELFD